MRRVIQQTALRVRGGAPGGRMAPTFIQRRTDVDQVGFETQHFIFPCQYILVVLGRD